jgi:hypothetical protein
MHFSRRAPALFQVSPEALKPAQHGLLSPEKAKRGMSEVSAVFGAYEN